MKRADKERVVAELGEQLGEANVVIVADYQGLDVAEMTRLRTGVRESGGWLRVVKNRLARLALKDGPFAELSRYLAGPTAFAAAKEPVAISKALWDFADSNENLVIRVGLADGDVLTVDQIGTLAKLPSLDELRGRIVGLVAAPATQLARTIVEPGAGLARVLAARDGS